MEWDADKLNALIKHFGLTGGKIGKALGIESKTIYNLTTGSYSFEKYNERLSAYLDALKKGKRAEYESMIAYYENFEP
jgi:DNA-binding XRE family transcriptional regulator